MDYTAASVILASIVTLLGIIFNPKTTKRFNAIEDLINNNTKTNEVQHVAISTTLEDHGKLFNVLLTVKDVKACLNKIVGDALVYSEDRNLSEWIATEGKTFVVFCEDVLSAGISKINCKSFKADVNVLITSSVNTTTDYLGNDFLKLIEKEHADRIIGFRNEILVISSDYLMNSKIDRFRAKGEIFLQEYLASTIIAYNKFKK